MKGMINDTTTTTGYMYVSILFIPRCDPRMKQFTTPSNERVWGYNLCTDTPRKTQRLEPENRFSYQLFVSWQVELLFPQPPVFSKCHFFWNLKNTPMSTSLAVAMHEKTSLPSYLRVIFASFHQLGRLSPNMFRFHHIDVCNASRKSVWRVVHKPSNCSCLDNMRSIVDFLPS